MDFLSIIIAALLSEDGSVERHIIWGNSVTAEQVKSFISIEEFEHVVRGTVAQAFSCVGIDVIHHERDVSLGESIQAFAFRDEHAYELMVPLRRTLLVRSLRIAVEQARTHDAFFIVLDLRRVGELAAVVGKEYSEDLHEKFSSEQAIKHVEDRNNGSGIVVIANESEHALSFDEVDGEKDFASFLALYRVYLSDRDVRMLIEENVEILKSAIDAALLVHLKDPLLFPGLESDLTGKIDVLSRDSSGIDEAIDRPLADHDRVSVVDTDVMRRLTLLDKRGDHGIEFSKFCLGEGYPGPGLRAKLFIIPLGVFGLVKHLLNGAFFALVTAIADEGRSIQTSAAHPLELGTRVVA